MAPTTLRFCDDAQYGCDATRWRVLRDVRRGVLGASEDLGARPVAPCQVRGLAQYAACVGTPWAIFYAGPLPEYHPCPRLVATDG